jgi:hypothetical protein
MACHKGKTSEDVDKHEDRVMFCAEKVIRYRMPKSLFCPSEAQNFRSEDSFLATHPDGPDVQVTFA